MIEAELTIIGFQFVTLGAQLWLGRDSKRTGNYSDTRSRHVAMLLSANLAFMVSILTIRCFDWFIL